MTVMTIAGGIILAIVGIVILKILVGFTVIMVVAMLTKK